MEKWFLGIVTIQLVFMPWAFGTMHVWSQVTALALSLVVFVVALVPRVYEAEHLPLGARSMEQGARSQGPRAGNTDRLPLTPYPSALRVVPWPRLLRFPLFWLGLGLLLLLGLQALNPSWVWERDTKTWWLRRVADIAWLPTGVDTPFERFNLWRQFIIYATVWLTGCALWIGITRRRSMQILLGVLVGNAVILGMVGFVNRATGTAQVLWLREFPGASSFASFVYQNHAGAYFSILSFVAMGLAVWHFFEGRRRMARSTPAALWLLGALLLVFAVIFSLSRGAVISLVAFGFAAVVAVVVLRLTSSTASTTPPLVPALVGLMIVGTIGYMVRNVDFSAVQYRFQEMARLQANDPSVVSRNLARESATAMLSDHWLRGVGAGGFRYLFPEYIKDKPMIYERGQFFWEHAHIDWLEIPIELGLTGVLLIAGGFGWAAWRWLHDGGWKNPLTLMIALGLGQVMAHALIDFPFQNPAILTTWWALLVISLRWLEVDRAA